MSDQSLVLGQQVTLPKRSRDAVASSSVAWLDIVVYAVITLLGVSAFLFHFRSSDFLGEDVFYADCARSLLKHGFYGIDAHPETNQPPGMSAMLALLFTVFSDSFSTCLRAMAVFEVLGFIAAFEVLKRHSSRTVAAIVCIVLMSSPIYFQLTTQNVNPCLPVLFTTMAAVLAFRKYEKATTQPILLLWGMTLTVMVVAAVMFASASIALLGAMIAVIVATFFRDQRLARRRALRLLPVLVVGLTVQGLWMHRKPAPLEWPLPGYPAPYLQQLMVKSGNYPELGMASVGDIPVRIESNALKQMDLLAQVFLRHGVNVSKVAIVITPVLLIAAGWAYSMWESSGESFVAWYFAGYQFIYLLWPWGVERRFFLPVAPLACLYAWKGVKAVHTFVTAKPRVVGTLWTPLALVLGISGCHWLYTHRLTNGWGVFPDELLAPGWLISSGWAAWMAYTGRPPAIFVPGTQSAEWWARPISVVGASPRRVVEYALGGVLVMLLGIGLTAEAKMARENVAPPDMLLIRDTSINPMALDIESALWVRFHTPSDSIIMARHVPLVHHYAERSLVWFAPISNPDVLMQGIGRHKVNYVVVVKHYTPYYLPDDDYCFDKLLAVHPDAFRLVFQDSNIRIFSVMGRDRGDQVGVMR
jgi:hypothetical protein